MGIQNINRIIYGVASVGRRFENESDKREVIATAFEKQTRAKQVVEDYNRNNYLMAQGVPSEIQILENMPTLDYYTHFYNWLEQNERKKQANILYSTDSNFARNHDNLIQ